jgi:hypothetical protein
MQMRPSKRKLVLLIAALLLVGTVLAFWFVAPERKLGLHLAFIAYTNEALPAGPTMVVYSPLALVQASNSGNYRLELLNSLRRVNYPSKDFARPLPHGFPMTLKPGETTIVRVRCDGWRVRLGEPEDASWRTEIVYRRSGASDRLLGQIYKIAGKQGRQWLTRIGVWPDPHYATCGPITNALPHVPRIISLTNYFIDLPDPQLSPPGQRPFNIHEILTNFPPKPSVGYEAREK